MRVGVGRPASKVPGVPIVLLARGRVDDRRHEAHALGREPAAAGVLEHDVLVRRDVDAVDLVRRDVALDPPDLRAEPGNHLVGLGADVVHLDRRQGSGPGQRTLDDVLRHGFPPAYSWYRTWSTSFYILQVRIMHTPGTDVKGATKDRRVAQGVATRDALLTAARELF